jgi:secretion/DNA translocation related TadE-like protein
VTAGWFRPVRLPEGRDGQRGSGTVLAAAAVFTLLAVTAAALVVAAYLAAAGRARGAADLVAVSAAAEQVRRNDGCRVAGQVAELNKVRLARCAVSGDSLDFVVSVVIRQPVALRVPLLPDGVLATSHAGRLGIVAPS